MVIHALPFWFVVFARFLPRIALVVAWLQATLVPFHLVGWIPLLFWALLPRGLVLYLIYLDQGLSGWFLVHAVVALIGWAGSRRAHSPRRPRNTSLTVSPPT